MRNTISSVVIFIAAVSTVSLAQHNVTVNDTDTSIQYEGQAGDATLCKYDVNGQFVGGQSGCYNVPSNCTSSAAMVMNKTGAASFKFRGSAIYVNSLLYDLSPLYMVTLDGKGSDIDGVRPSEPFICDTLFSRVSLNPNVDHEIRLSIKDLSPNRNTTREPKDFYIFSLISFVYTIPDSQPTSSSHTPIGPAVGGAVGGVVVILAILFIFFYIRRNRRLHPRRDAVEIDPDPIVPMSENDTLRLGDNQPYRLNHTLTNPGAEALSTTTVDQPSPQMSKALPPPRADHIAHLSPTALDIPTALVPSPPANIQISAVVQPSTQHPNSAAPGIHVTPQETRLLNSLYSRNVPAAEIAAMIEAMREARDASPRVEGSSGGVAHGDPRSEPVDPPPEYDFKGK